MSCTLFCFIILLKLGLKKAEIITNRGSSIVKPQSTLIFNISALTHWITYKPLSRGIWKSSSIRLMGWLGSSSGNSTFLLKIDLASSSTSYPFYEKMLLLRRFSSSSWLLMTSRLISWSSATKILPIWFMPDWKRKLSPYLTELTLGIDPLLSSLSEISISWTYCISMP